MKAISFPFCILLFLTACGGGGSAPTPAPPTATVSISASDTDVMPGQSTTLTYSSTDATSCTASGDWSDASGVSGSVDVAVSKEGDNIFSIQCGNSSVSSVTVVGIATPTVTLDSTENIDALKQVTITATISDPQNRILSSDWSKTYTSGEDFSYDYTPSSITFTPPQECNYQTITATLVIDYDIANNDNGEQASVEVSSGLTVIPAIPATPANFSATAGSQSATFKWDESTGTCSYSYYYQYDDGGLTESSAKLDTSSVGEGSLVGIVNDRNLYLAVTATNVSGESSLSNEVSIVATGPESESTGQPNSINSNLSEIDYWGNIIGGYSGTLSADAMCLKDNITGGIWGVKKPVNTSSIHYTFGTYTYYDDTNVVNGVNDFGNKNINGTSCSFSEDSSLNLYCNSQDYLSHINAGEDEGEAYCGVSNWRLPSGDEAIQAFWHIDEGEVWTSSSVIEDAPTRQIISALHPWATASTCDWDCVRRVSKSTTQKIAPISMVNEVDDVGLDYTIECIDWEIAQDQPRSEYAPTYTLEQLEDKASFISNQSGIDWVVPSMYELVLFKDLLRQSPGPEFTVCANDGCTLSNTYTPEYRVLTSTSNGRSAPSNRNYHLKRMEDGVTQFRSSSNEGTFQMCFKGPVGEEISE